MELTPLEKNQIIEDKLQKLREEYKNAGPVKKEIIKRQARALELSRGNK